MIHLSEKQTC